MSTGKVYIVGAGPGDPGLLTIRAVELLGKADTILYDYLCGEGFLAYKRPEAEALYIGKRGHQHYTPQEIINQLLLAKASEGRTVVRLKGGDPFVFGRGGEEAEWLHKHGIAFEVVPGISSAMAAPAYAGIPVTHRDLSSSVAVVTGHRKSTGDEDDIPTPNTDTVVYLMGITNLPRIVKGLLESGRSSGTPVAVIRWGTRPHQRTVIGTLRNIVGRVRKQKVTPPAVVVVGQVVTLREKLDWFESAQEMLAESTIPGWGDEESPEAPGRKKKLPGNTVHFNRATPD